MPKTSPIITNFTSGELSPRLEGRVDVKQYFNGAKTLENMLIEPYGGARNRPGSYYVTEVKDSTKATRVISFEFSTTQAYIIEMGDLYMRFYKDNGQIEWDIDDVTAWATTTSYVISDFVKEDSVIYHCIEAHESGTFATDLAAEKWVAQDAYEIVTPYLAADLFDIQFAQSADTLYITHNSYAPRKLTRSAHTTWTLTAIDYTATLNRPPLLPANITATTITPEADTGSDKTLTASVAIFTEDHEGSIWKVKDGYVQITTYTDTTHVQCNILYSGDLNTGPGATTVWAEGAWSDERGYPAAVTFYERRLAFGGSTYEPQTIWLSTVEEFEEMEVGSSDGDAMAFTIATEQVNAIQWLHAGKILAIGTSGGEFKLWSGSVDAPLTPTNLNIKKETSFGSKKIIPKRIGNFVYYIQRYGLKLREMSYDFDSDSYRSIDMTILSEHITESGIVDMAYQQNPTDTLWCVRDDGTMATFIREIDQEVKAWSRQVTDGYYESVAVIPLPSSNYDQTWTVVKRLIEGSYVRYIEYFKTPNFDEQEDAFFMDSGLSLDSPKTITDVATKVVLDDMEYATSVAAQAAWATSASGKAPPDLGDGTDGSKTVSSDEELEEGTYNYTSLTVDAGDTLTVNGNATIKVLGAVIINGTLELVSGTLNIYAISITVGASGKITTASSTYDVSGTIILRANTITVTTGGIIEEDITDTVAGRSPSSSGGNSGSDANVWDDDFGTYYAWVNQGGHTNNTVTSTMTFTSIRITRLVYKIMGNCAPEGLGTATGNVQINNGGWSTIASYSIQETAQTVQGASTTGWATATGIKSVSVQNDNPALAKASVYHHAIRIFGECRMDYINSSGVTRAATDVSDFVNILECYSEATIKEQGSYSLKGEAKATTSLNKTLTRTISATISLSGKDEIKFDIRASRTGSHIKIGFHDSGGITTEHTANILVVNTWQTETIDISGVSNANKDAIDSIIITITNADADNIFYIDNIYGVTDTLIISSTAHGFSDGDRVIIRDVLGTTQLNGEYFKVYNKSTNAFELTDLSDVAVDGAEYDAYVAGGEVRKCVNSVSNLDHLEGKEVAVFVDGQAHANKVVATGAITLDDYYGQIHVGLPYESIIKTLRVEAGSAIGTAQMKTKRIFRVGIRFYRTMGANFGAAEASLDAMSLGTELFTGDEVVAFPHGFDRNAYVVIKQTQPLPLYVLAIVPWIEVSDE